VVLSNFDQSNYTKATIFKIRVEKKKEAYFNPKRPFHTLPSNRETAFNARVLRVLFDEGHLVWDSKLKKTNAQRKAQVLNLKS